MPQWQPLEGTRVQEQERVGRTIHNPKETAVTARMRLEIFAEREAEVHTQYHGPLVGRKEPTKATDARQYLSQFYQGTAPELEGRLTIVGKSLMDSIRGVKTREAHADKMENDLIQLQLKSTQQEKTLGAVVENMESRFSRITSGSFSSSSSSASSS